MARVKNTMKLINQAKICINKNYSLYVSNIDDIYKASNDSFMLITNSFRFGYMQGMKAAKAELKKDGILNG